VVLTALSRPPTSRANAEKAERLLERMERPVEQGGYDVEPDKMSYVITILACARCSTTSEDKEYAAAAAEKILVKMEARAAYEQQRRDEVSSAAPPAVVLDAECFNVVLTAISRCRHQRDAPHRAIRILQRMEQYAAAGQESLRPTTRSWNGKLFVLVFFLSPCSIAVVPLLTDILFNTLCTFVFLAILNAFARASSCDRSFARKAEHILERLFTMHRSGVPNVKPNAFTYSA